MNTLFAFLQIKKEEKLRNKAVLVHNVIYKTFIKKKQRKLKKKLKHFHHQNAEQYFVVSCGRNHTFIFLLLLNIKMIIVNIFAKILYEKLTF